MTSAPDSDSLAALFERAVAAVVGGDAEALAALLREHPDLARARSTRVTQGDPPVHGATLLHYLAANGVEDERQRSPKNAPRLAELLLAAGADPDAFSSAYGSRCTTLSLLVSSTPPATAGVQLPLINVLLDHGAAMTPRGEGHWTSSLITALVFGFVDAARLLVERGAPVDTMAAAAGLGRIEEVRRRLPTATSDDRHRALALAALLGHPEIVALVIDAGEDPNRYNPPGMHAHSVPLHQATSAGHLAVVKALVERGARLDIRDMIHRATPLGWARYCKQPGIEAYLIGLGAPL